MCIIKDVSDWLCHEFYLISVLNCSNRHSFQSFLLLIPIGEQISCGEALSWTPHPIPFSSSSCPAPSLFIRQLALCTGSAAAQPGDACLLFLLIGCTSGLEAEWFTLTNTINQITNPAGSAAINHCFPHPQGSQSSFLLTQSMQCLHYSLHLGWGVGNVRWADMSKVIEFIIRRIRDCACWVGASMEAVARSGSIR